jgi:CBS domain-containing protein
MKKLVRDLMHPGMFTCRPDATLGQVSVLLTQYHVHALIVTDRDDHPIGIISDYDLLAGEWLSADSQSLATMRNLTAGELMSSPIDTIEAGMSLGKAALVSDFVSSIAREEKPLRETVADVMSDAILVCRDKTPLTSAARTMTQAGWRSVLVVDAKGKPEGVVSGKDLLPYVENGVDKKLTVRDIMHPALTIDINARLREAADLMIQNHYHRLVVIDNNDPEAFPLGIISSFDIVAEMARPGSTWQK